jgi:predicted transcriptional regulator
MTTSLESKGHVRHAKDGAKFVFAPVISAEKAKRAAVRHLIQTFFNGSPEQAVAALLDVSSSKLSEVELDRLAGIIKKARKSVKS